MTRGYHSSDDPEKGTPHRHTRAKIWLLVSESYTEGTYRAILMKLAEKRPGDVLDAVLEVLGEDRTQGVTKQVDTHAEPGKVLHTAGRGAYFRRVRTSCPGPPPHSAEGQAS